MSNETTAVARVPPRQQQEAAPQALALTSLDQYVRLAEAVAPVFGPPAQCLARLMAGAELGFLPLASLSGVHVIEGKPSLGSHLIAAAIKRSVKYDFEIVSRDAAGEIVPADRPGAIEQNTDRVCEVAFYERSAASGGLSRKFSEGWRLAGRLRYTIEAAREKGWHLTQGGKEKGPWAKTPRNMLFARVIVDGYKTYAPDLYGGMLVYEPDELDAAERPAANGPVTVIQNGAASPPLALPARQDEESAEPDPRQQALARVEAARQERYGGGAAPNAQAPADGSEATPAKVTAEQLDSLRAICREKKRTKEDVQVMLATVNLHQIADLPQSLLNWAASILTDGQITPHQSDSIAAIIQTAGIPWQRITARLKEKYGVDRLKMLTQPQAAEMERLLLEKRTVRTQQQPAAASA